MNMSGIIPAKQLGTYPAATSSDKHAREACVVCRLLCDCEKLLL
jgi:hypothetical protein